MEEKFEDRKTPWWKFVLAVICFVGLFFAAPLVCNLVFIFIDFFSPKAFKNTQEWMYILSMIFGIAIACSSIEVIVEKRHPVFCMVLCIILAFYMVAVSVWNYAVGTIKIINLIGMWIGAIISIIYAVQYGISSTKSKEKND